MFGIYFIAYHSLGVSVLRTAALSAIALSAYGVSGLPLLSLTRFPSPALLRCGTLSHWERVGEIALAMRRGGGKVFYLFF